MKPLILRTLILAGFVFLFGMVVIEYFAVRSDRNALLAEEQYDRSLQELGEGRYRIMARRVKNERAIRARLEEENKELYQDLRKARADESSLTEIVIQAPPETLTIAQPETIHAELGIREYLLEFEGATVHATLDSSDRMEASIEYPPIDIITAIYRRPDRTWWADVQISKPFEVGDMRVMVDDPRPGWLRRNLLWILPVGAIVLWEAVR